MLRASEAVNILNDFKDVDALAAFLREAGIKGEKQDAESCVLTNWILNNVDCFGASTSDEFYIDAGDSDGTYPISDCCQKFIQMFDDGFYPELEEEFPEDYGCTCPGCNFAYGRL